MTGPVPGSTVLAGWDAVWNSVEPDVRDDAGRPLRATPASLYMLRDAESAIDAGALLRERVLADPPYWALVWTGARAIAACVAGMELGARTRVLDLGCGLGLSGLAAVAAGATVTFADYLDEPLAFVRATLERTPAARADVRRIDFTTAGTVDGGPWDLILAADIVYEPAHYEALAAFLDRHLAVGGSILLTESLRADARVFLDGLLARGFRDAPRALWVLEDGRRERTWLHELERTEHGG